MYVVAFWKCWHVAYFCWQLAAEHVLKKTYKGQGQGPKVRGQGRGSRVEGQGSVVSGQGGVLFQGLNS
jgi:hypothetical protein